MFEFQKDNTSTLVSRLWQFIYTRLVTFSLRKTLLYFGWIMLIFATICCKMHNPGRINFTMHNLHPDHPTLPKTTIPAKLVLSPVRSRRIPILNRKSSIEIRKYLRHPQHSQKIAHFSPDSQIILIFLKKQKNIEKNRENFLQKQSLLY